MAFVQARRWHDASRHGVTLGCILIAQSRHCEIAALSLRLRGAQPAPFRCLLCIARELLRLARSRYVLFLRPQQQCVRSIVAAVVNRSLRFSHKNGGSRVARIEHRPSIQHCPVPRRDLPQLRRYLLKWHVLLADDAEKANYCRLREAKLLTKFRCTNFSFCSSFAAHRDLLRKDFGHAKLV